MELDVGGGGVCECLWEGGGGDVVKPPVDPETLWSLGKGKASKNIMVLGE